MVRWWFPISGHFWYFSLGGCKSNIRATSHQIRKDHHRKVCNFGSLATWTMQTNASFGLVVTSTGASQKTTLIENLQSLQLLILLSFWNIPSRFWIQHVWKCCASKSNKFFGTFLQNFICFFASSLKRFNEVEGVGWWLHDWLPRICGNLVFNNCMLELVVRRKKSL